MTHQMLIVSINVNKFAEKEKYLDGQRAEQQAGCRDKAVSWCPV